MSHCGRERKSNRPWARWHWGRTAWQCGEEKERDKKLRMAIGASMSRKPLKLSKSLQRDLSLYVLATGAAGASMLALTQSADAEVVYTPIYQRIGSNHEFAIDLNHDG